MLGSRHPASRRPRRLGSLLPDRVLGTLGAERTGTARLVIVRVGPVLDLAGGRGQAAHARAAPRLLPTPSREHVDGATWRRRRRSTRQSRRTGRGAGVTSRQGGRFAATGSFSVVSDGAPTEELHMAFPAPDRAAARRSTAFRWPRASADNGGRGSGPATARLLRRARDRPGRQQRFELVHRRPLSHAPTAQRGGRAEQVPEPRVPRRGRRDPAVRRDYWRKSFRPPARARLVQREPTSKMSTNATMVST